MQISPSSAIFSSAPGSDQPTQPTRNLSGVDIVAGPVHSLMP
jgi:hypothetical protein